MIDIDELKEYYATHSMADTEKHFNTSRYYLFKMLDANGIERHTDSVGHKLSGKNDRLERVPLEDLKEYYRDHTIKETAKHFHVSFPVISRMLDENNIPKRGQKQAIAMGVEHLYGTDLSEMKAQGVEKAKNTSMQKYGVDSYSKTPEFKERCTATWIEKYGVDHPRKLEENKIKYKETIKKKYESAEAREERYRKRYESCMDKYGCASPMQSEQVKEKIINTCTERYGVPFPCMRKEARLKGNNSKVNTDFEQLLDEFELQHEREFSLGAYSYDFKVEDALIELDPSITHNIAWTPFRDHQGISEVYHMQKANFARDNGYRCINIFDWDDRQKILNSLLPKKNIYARKCTISVPSMKEVEEFLNNYHFQNFIKYDIAIGLYYEGELYEVMTFGKPRYNKNYEYELLRLCTKSGYSIVGGSERLFKYFVTNYNPQSIISYCDLSKFDGRVYQRLGFSEGRAAKPSKHWFNLKTKEHITDNLLRQRGFDQLLGRKYGTFGKGTDNEKLMLDHGFVPVCDCGQQPYYWKIKESGTTEM